MKPALRPPAELLLWVDSIVAREQATKLYGKVVVHLENGVIVRVVTEKIEKPPG